MKYLITCSLLLLGVCLWAQEDDAYEEEEGAKGMYWGFTLSVETGILSGEENPTFQTRDVFKEVETTPGFGVSAGLSTYIPLSSFLALRPQAVISIIPTQMRYDRVGFEREFKFFYPLTADIPIHLMINNPLQSEKLGGFVGGAIEFNIPGMESADPTGTEYNLRIDGGLTLPLNLGHGNYLLDFFYGYSPSNLIGGDTVYDLWWRSVTRYRTGVRLHLL
ncbi:hypothetical protein [Sanyastnella coralliicola]|uniref:hypothetical protein n=1 Tax=Sanyastnella coralliicola TaxID=3069118 RepID=UPI0027BA310E|nr:hypothetical protein [Longitalea sp. SCSIO 12813]